MVIRQDSEPEIVIDDRDREGSRAIEEFAPIYEYQTSKETGITLPDSQYDISQYHSSWSSLPSLPSTDVLSRSSQRKPVKKELPVKKEVTKECSEKSFRSLQ